MTSPKPLKFEKKTRDHETIFLNHYDWLLDWARQHTQGAAEEAEDLVQDLYVRFVQMKSGPDLADDDQIRAYLYASLKNLFTSKKLRSGRDAVSGLLAVDFDSIQFVLSAVDRSRLFHVRSDLAGICEYACIRRKTNRAASALILRFFLGFLPTEVMALLKAKRSNVDTLIETARLEAKAYLARPGVLRFLNRGERKSAFFPRYLPEQPEALFAELQRRIFSETEGTCFALEALKDRYSRPDAPALSTQEIAHIASCRTCLNQASRLLSLPDATVRFFDEGNPPDETRPPSAGTGEGGLKKLRRKLRETYEHRPKKLQIAVDGEVRGVQTITSASSNFQIALAPLSHPGFVEVLSEQGVGLLYFDLQQEAFEVPGPRVAAVSLSDGRQLSVSLILSGGAPLIDISYYDPLLEGSKETPPSAQAAIVHQSEFDSSEQERIVEAPSKADRWLSAILPHLKGRRPWTLSIAISLCILIVLGIAYTRTPRIREKQLTAARVLEQSIHQAASAAPPHGAVRQVFSLEIRSKKDQGTTTAQVDCLRSADPPLRALRLRSSDGNLLEGVSVDIHGKAREVLQPAKSKPGGTPHGFQTQDKLWQHPPNTEDFERLAGNDADLALNRVQDGYEVSFRRRPASQNNASIVEGRLVIADATMRPIAEILRIEDGDDTREYRFWELRYEVLSAAQVRASDFSPASTVFNLRATSPAIGSPHLILEALQVLSNQPQKIQAAVDLERHSNDAIEVTGVLSTREEARSLIQSLRALPSGAALKIDIHTIDEPPSALHVVTTERSPTLSVTGDRIALDGMLRESLIRSGPSEAILDERVKEAAREILARDARIRRAAWQVSQIGSRDFRTGELAAMDARDRQLWLALLSRSLALCDTELTVISAILGQGPDRSRQELDPIATVGELATTADSFRENADRLDRLLVAGFALSPEGSATTAVSEVELLNQLTKVQLMESRLEFTIQHLQQAIPQHRTE